MPLFEGLPKIFKKLASISATFLLVIEASKKDIILEKILYIHYLLCFQKNIIDVKTLNNFSIEANVMILAYFSKLGLQI